MTNWSESGLQPSFLKLLVISNTHPEAVQSSTFADEPHFVEFSIKWNEMKWYNSIRRVRHILIKGYLCCFISLHLFLTCLVLNFVLGNAQLCDPLIPVSLPTVFWGSGGLTSPCTSPLSGSSTILSAITPSVFVCACQIFPLLKYLLVKRQDLWRIQSSS